MWLFILFTYSKRQKDVDMVSRLKKLNMRNWQKGERNKDGDKKKIKKKEVKYLGSFRKFLSIRNSN